MYGTLDAAEQWSLHYAERLKDGGFLQGTASPCHFFHPQMNVSLLVHGDDFLAVGRKEGRQYLDDLLKNHYVIKAKTLGPDSGEDKQIRVLGRVLTWENWGIQVEADPGHHELVVESLALADAKSVVTPGETADHKLKAAEIRERRRRGDEDSSRRNEELWSPDWEYEDYRDVEDGDDQPLPEDQAALYASLSARVNYLSLDRPDLQFSAKELMRRLSAPTVGSMRALKRMGRYLIGARRLACRFYWQPLRPEITVQIDANHAGCVRTRLTTVRGSDGVEDT